MQFGLIPSQRGGKLRASLQVTHARTQPPVFRSVVALRKVSTRNLKAFQTRSSGSSAGSITIPSKFLTPKQTQHFQKHGWLAVPNFWEEDELLALRTALTQLAQQGKLANVATDGDGKTHTEKPLNLQLCPLSPHADIFRSLQFHPRVASSIHQLLCDSDPTQSAATYLSQVFWKPALHGLGTSWHQDNAYFNIPAAHKGTAMWTAIHDATLHNGTLTVVDAAPEILKHEREPMSDHHITCKALVDETKAVPLEVPAGSVIFFNFNVPHSTGPNNSDKARAGIAYHFINQSHFKDREFPLPEDAEWMTPVVVGPKCTNGESEYGFAANTWDADMSKLLKEGVVQNEDIDPPCTVVKQDDLAQK